MSKMSIKDLIAQKQKDISAKKGRARTWKPKPGKSRVRILPSWRGLDDPHFFHDFGVHFVKNEKKETDAIYLCTEATFGKECPVCQAIGQGIKNSNDDDQIKLLKSANAGQRYLMNVLVLSEDDIKSEPQIMEVGTTVFESICEIISEYDDITKLEGGVDLVITREGSGQFDTKYTVMPAPKSVKVPESVYQKVHNLDEYVAQENEESRNKAVAAVSRAAGFMLASDDSFGGPANALPGGKTAALPDAEMGSVMDDIDLDGIEDAEVIESPAAEAVTEPMGTSSEEVATDFDDDELDDLLADLG